MQHQKEMLRVLHQGKMPEGDVTMSRAEQGRTLQCREGDIKGHKLAMQGKRHQGPKYYNTGKGTSRGETLQRQEGEVKGQNLAMPGRGR